MLSETEIEKNEVYVTAAEFQVEITNRTPMVILSALTLSIVAVRGNLKCALTEPRYMRQGKAITQRFMEWIT